MPIKNFIRPLVLIDLSELSSKDFVCLPENVENFEKPNGKIAKGSAVYFHFGWCKRWSDSNRYRGVSEDYLEFPSIESSVADLLVRREISLLGGDTLSPDVVRCGVFPIHERLLQQGICILENLGDPINIQPKGYKICAVPLRLEGAHESPARVFAFREYV